MSVSTTRTDTCAYCTQEFDIYNAVEGSYCSQACHDRHRGEKLLNTVNHSHQYCALCGTRLKEVEPPKPDWAFDNTGGSYEATEDGVTFTFHGQEESRRSAIGFEYTTDAADTGEKTAYRTDSFELITSGIVCGECGNASLTDPQEEIQRDHLFEYASQILDSLRERKADGEFDCEIDEQTVFDVLVDVPDLALAVGIARE